PKKHVYPVITISREFGANGAAFAAYLARKIGYKVWDKELLQAITDEVGTGLKTVESIDERRRQTVEDTVTGFFHNMPTNVSYSRSLIRVVNTIEEFGNSIIVGRGANYICKNSKALHVRIVSPLNYRIENYAKRENISKIEAKRLIEAKDYERKVFIYHNFHREMNESSDYDMVINTKSFTLDEMAEIVINAYEKKAGILVKVYE
ncbi:MAG: cytidylate kinase-like family protein, partial [Candidatus Paceibacterota bacterium]